MMTKKKKIMVVDDHPIVHQGLEMLLGHESNLEICGYAATANEAIDKIKDLEPHLVLVDISLKGGVSGIDLIKGIRDRYPAVETLVLSMHDESIYAERVIRAGARGYVKKEELTKTIVNAIQTVLEGRIYLSNTMTTSLLKDLYYDQVGKVKVSIDKLTDRELEVLRFISRGYRTSDIAKKLNVSVKTIDSHRLRIKRKLNLKSSAEMIKFAVEWFK